MVKINRFVAAAALFLPGCVLSPAQRNTRYEADYRNFKPAAFRKNTLVYRNPKRHVFDFKQFLLEPVKVYPRPVSKINPEDRAKFDDFAAQLTESTAAVFKDSYPMATQPGEGVLRIVIEVNDLKPISKHTNSDGNEAIRYGGSTKGSKLQISAVDSVTGEEIYLLTSFLEGEKYNVSDGMLKVEALRHAFEDWTTFLHTLLEDAKNRQAAR